MSDTPSYPLQIFFDGSCSLCTAKMAAYQVKEHGGRLQFVDVSAPEFDPAPYGITLEAFMHEMHAIDRAGRVYRGVDAFRAIWQAFPATTRYRLFGILMALPGVHLLARAVYWCIAWLRRYLPESRDACKGGTCRGGRDAPHR